VGIFLMLGGTALSITSLNCMESGLAETHPRQPRGIGVTIEIHPESKFTLSKRR
jgi:hypothetical protein